MAAHPAGAAPNSIQAIPPHMRATASHTPGQGTPVASVPTARHETLAQGIAGSVGRPLEDEVRLQMGGQGMWRIREASVRQGVGHEEMSVLVVDAWDARRHPGQHREAQHERQQRGHTDEEQCAPCRVCVEARA